MNKRRIYFFILISLWHFLLNPLWAQYDLSKGNLLVLEANENNPEGRLLKIMAMAKENAKGKGKNQHVFDFILDGVPFSMGVTKNEERYYFNLEGSSQRGDEMSCLTYILNPEDRTGHVDQIYTAGNDCLPGVEKKGNFILKVVDQISTIVGIESNSLEDASEVKCGDSPDKKTSLTFLHTMKSGESWYGSKGYNPDDRSLDEFKTDINFLRQYDIKKMWQQVKALAHQEITRFPMAQNEIIRLKDEIFKLTKIDVDSESIQNDLILRRILKERNISTEDIVTSVKTFRERNYWKNYLNYFDLIDKNQKMMDQRLEEFQKTAGPYTLGSFMTWLSPQDCDSFEAIKEMLLPEKNIKIATGYDWLSLYRYIFSSTSLVKVYPQPIPNVAGQCLANSSTAASTDPAYVLIQSIEKIINGIPTQ